MNVSVIRYLGYNDISILHIIYTYNIYIYIYLSELKITVIRYPFLSFLPGRQANGQATWLADKLQSNSSSDHREITGPFRVNQMWYYACDTFSCVRVSIKTFIPSLYFPGTLSDHPFMDIYIIYMAIWLYCCIWISCLLSPLTSY